MDCFLQLLMSQTEKIPLKRKEFALYITCESWLPYAVRH